MSFDLDSIVSDIRDLLENNLPDLSSYEEDMEELEELREAGSSFEEQIEALDKETTELKARYDLMLTDLIKVNLNHAVLSPHEHVRALALQVAKEMAESQRGRHENEILPPSQAVG